MKKLLKIFKYGKIERFGITTLIFFALMITFFILGYAETKSNEEMLYEYRTLYYTGFNLTNNDTISFMGLYMNDEKTDATIFFKTNDGNSLSIDANDYSSMIIPLTRGGEPAPIIEPVNMSLYMFGSTGYGAMRFISARPFALQKWCIYLYCNRPLKSYNTVYGSFIVNLGGKAVDKAEFYKLDTYDPKEIYRELLVKNDEINLRFQATEKLQEMQDQMNLIKANRLKLEQIVLSDGRKVAIPDYPKEMASDYFETDENGYVVRLNTGYSFAGAYDIDWKTKNAKDGYINVVGDDIANYIKQHDELAKSNDNLVWFDMDWYLSDGSIFKVDGLLSNVAEYNTLNNIISEFKNSINQYLTMKKSYQTQFLKEFALLQLNSRISTFTANISENFCIINKEY